MNRQDDYVCDISILNRILGQIYINFYLLQRHAIVMAATAPATASRREILIPAINPLCSSFSPSPSAPIDSLSPSEPIDS